MRGLPVNLPMEAKEGRPRKTVDRTASRTVYASGHFGKEGASKLKSESPLAAVWTTNRAVRASSANTTVLRLLILYVVALKRPNLEDLIHYEFDMLNVLEREQGALVDVAYGP